MGIIAGVINSVSINNSIATINCTPSNDTAYSYTQILYQRFGASTWTLGATDTGVADTASDISQPNITEPFLYIFMVLMADINDNFSLPSNTVTSKNADVISESGLFIENAKILISNSNNFMRWTNTLTAEAAKLRIDEKEISTLVNSNPLFPMCVLYDGNSSESSKIDLNNFLMNATIDVLFIANCSDDRERDEAKIAREFLADVEKIISDIKNLESVDAFLIVNKISKVDVPFFFNTRDNTEGIEDLICVKYKLEAGG